MLLALFVAQSSVVTALAQTDNKKPQQQTEKAKQEEQPKRVATPKPGTEFTPDQIAEGVILAYGTRPGLEQIRRNGVERGRLTRISTDGRTEEASYERRFIRGDALEKDKVRLDQKTPTLEYSLVYGDGKTWGFLNGATFTPRQATTTDFLSQMWHGLDALLRYKENGSTITLVGKDKQQNIDLYVIDVVDKEKRKTRYYVSQKSFRVLWLEYEEGLLKYKRTFHDYRVVQGTLVPYRTVLYAGDRQVEESQVLTVTYGVKTEDSVFAAEAAAAQQ